ncbi:MAG: hypothetical protein NTV46_20545 [Verrucomicrobia bacterium]|nr:hypothetical protein [Verrucomicrobiota bacterium]
MNRTAQSAEMQTQATRVRTLAIAALALMPCASSLNYNSHTYSNAFQVGPVDGDLGVVSLKPDLSGVVLPVKPVVWTGAGGDIINQSSNDQTINLAGTTGANTGTHPTSNAPGNATLDQSGTGLLKL